ncbi:hypothetical protein BBB03_01425 [Candidatus Portiera aleyrodidarum]|nr:hypothetical protein BBB03_01425 [Candidatus Portiera aleyrodidarum]
MSYIKKRIYILKEDIVCKKKNICLLAVRQKKLCLLKKVLNERKRTIKKVFVLFMSLVFC